MNGLILCLLAFGTCLGATVPNWRYGLCIFTGWGYFFGILKAHYVQSQGHFIFDAATLGFFGGLVLNMPPAGERQRYSRLLPWFVLLISWPIFIALIPIQHYLVQLVGLRGNIFWLPMLLVGCLMDKKGIGYFSITLSVLNLISFLFALGEYFLGVEVFVPENDVTKIVYNSVDIAGGHKRIPSIFVNAHSYGGTMVTTLPWLIGPILDKEGGQNFRLVKKIILMQGIFCALLGCFYCGPSLAYCDSLLDGSVIDCFQGI